MYWNVIEIDGVRSLLDSDLPIPDNAILIGATADENYFLQPKPRLLTKLEFRRLFTTSERVAIDNSVSNMDLPMQARNVMNTMLTDFALADDVNLDDAEVLAALQFISSIGLLQETRISEILS